MSKPLKLPWLVLLFILLIPIHLCAQKVVENKIDDFTKHAVKRTSWEPFVKGFNYYTYCRISKIDDTYWLDFKMFTNGIKSVQENSDLMIMSTSDSVVTLKNSEHKVSCTGCAAIGFAGSAAPGLYLNFLMSDSIVQFLKTNEVKKFRLYMTDGYKEQEISKKQSQLLMNEILLIEKL